MSNYEFGLAEYKKHFQSIRWLWKKQSEYDFTTVALPKSSPNTKHGNIA